MNLKNYDHAINSYKKVLELKSDHKDASFNLGVIHFDIRKYDIAENIFVAYLKSFRNDLEAERFAANISNYK